MSAKSELRPPNVSGGDECCENCPSFKTIVEVFSAPNEVDNPNGVCVVLGKHGLIVRRHGCCELWGIPTEEAMAELS